jgi:hypothetical protein
MLSVTSTDMTVKKSFMDSIVGGAYLTSLFMMFEGIRVCTPAENGSVDLPNVQSVSSKYSPSASTAGGDIASGGGSHFTGDCRVSLILSVGNMALIYGVRFQRLLVSHFSTKSTISEQLPFRDDGWDAFCLWSIPSVQRDVSETMNEYWKYLTPSMQAHTLEQVELARECNSNTVNIPNPHYKFSVLKAVSGSVKSMSLPYIVWIRSMQLQMAQHPQTPFEQLIRSKLELTTSGILAPTNMVFLLSYVTIGDHSVKRPSGKGDSLKLRTTGPSEITLLSSHFPLPFLLLHCSPVQLSLSEMVSEFS